MSIRRPGWLTSWPASPGIRPTGSTSYCPGTGGRTRLRAAGPPDHVGDQAVFTIGYVATLLGEDENWIFDLSISMCPKTVAFGSTVSARMGCPLSPEMASKTCARSSPMSVLPAADPPCGAHRMLTHDPWSPAEHRSPLSSAFSHGLLDFWISDAHTDGYTGLWRRQGGDSRGL